MLLKVRIKYSITALLLTSALCIGLTAPYLGRAELILLTTSLVVINSLLALLAIKECYVPVLTALVIEESSVIVPIDGVAPVNTGASGV